ncbi:MAG: L-aspartate oxidase [Oscillospiraceae bacterium]|jgi:L-aspartate oxidase|nr:L-aspartate oxidase [Oscillospiraceae bacterium]
MRYITNAVPPETERLKYDAVIVGCGIAGLYTALHIDESFSCCILTKENVEVSNSWLAQGGIAAAISVDDKPLYHFEDTMLAGAGLNDPDAVRLLVSEAPREIRALVDMQVPFDLNPDGELDITREGGHHRRRIVHAGGDATGRETVKALAALVLKRPNVVLRPHNFFVDVLTDSDGAVTGCTVLDSDGKLVIIDCANIVIATGGIGQLYTSSTNPAVATGDGLAAAARAGAKLRDMEFIQFHPTGLWTEKPEERAFLISESVRGEGGRLVNAAGERFMVGRHELAELAPRDIVAREIFREMLNTGAKSVFVDISFKSAEYLRSRFPTIFTECLSRGIDISKEPIPVCPVQHYLIGGIETDLTARSTVLGLYACGEAASSGVHGANRLASNSMLECLVFGHAAARDINRRLEAQAPVKSSLPDMQPRPEAELDCREARSQLQKSMTENCGVLRSSKGLTKAISDVQALFERLSCVFVPDRAYLETLNLTELARVILCAALSRTEGVGAHYREDEQ